ncbi:MAG TPA: C39 family peptidase [Candidatus Pacearchaeota archaeon]|nr:C39 family peptidase [Candidatus Pacearchaeota archaeon]
MKKILKFPDGDKQYHIASCGTKAMQKLILYKKGIEVPEMDLIKIANTSRKGTPIENMLRIADKFDLDYTKKYNYSIPDLINSIDKGNPALLSVQGWPNKKVKNWLIETAFGHYDVLTGYDTRKEQIFYYDPYDGKIKSMNYETLHLVAHDVDFKSKEVFDHFAVFFKD